MKLAAVLLVFKESSFLEACYSAIYPVVDILCVVSSYDRNLQRKAIDPDDTLEKLLSLPDPQNKVRLIMSRDSRFVPGNESESQLRNIAILNAPEADYYLIVDSDEIWETAVLRQAWQNVQDTGWAGYRVYSHFYFKKWNFRAVEPGEGYRPFVFLRHGFQFLQQRQINWRCPARYLEYLRKGRKPKTVYLPKDIRLHHGSSVGDDLRMQTKLANYSHAHEVDPDWFKDIWVNPPYEEAARHYIKGQVDLFEKICYIPTENLPMEIKKYVWPEGWIDTHSAVT
jgi:hypothetical protein